MRALGRERQPGPWGLTPGVAPPADRPNRPTPLAFIARGAPAWGLTPCAVAHIRPKAGESTLHLDRDWDPDHKGGDHDQTYVFYDAASLVVATGLFWARMLISPPVTLAATDAGIDVAEMVVPKDLPSFDDRYQRHTGVLDTLN